MSRSAKPILRPLATDGKAKSKIDGAVFPNVGDASEYGKQHYQSEFPADFLVECLRAMEVSFLPAPPARKTRR